MTWTFAECQKHWDGRRKKNDYRSIADCGWNRAREYMEWNEYEKCFDLILHGTTVVKVFPDKYVINCGGWWSNITRNKIGEWSGVRLGTNYSGRKYIEKRFVYYGNELVSVYYPRMECDLSGMPLKPLKPTGYVLRKGVADKFNNMAKQIRQRVMPRVLLGEFDGDDEDVHVARNMMLDSEALDHMRWVVERPESRFLSTNELAPLFVQRPRCSFGRPHHYWNGDAPKRTAAQRLEANIAAAKRAYLSSCQGIYEIVPKEFT